MRPSTPPPGSQPAPGARRHVVAAPPDLRIGPLLPVPGLLREAGIDPRPLLAASGLAASAFDDADTRLPFHAATHLLLAAAQATGRADFGLLVAQRFEFTSLGLLNLLVQRAPTVGDALRQLERHLQLHDRGAVVYLKHSDANLVALGYAVHDADLPGVGLAYDLSMAIGANLLRALCGPTWRALQVLLPRSRPIVPLAWRRSCGAPVIFDATAAEIWFDAAWLARRPPLADAAQQLELLRAAQRSEAEQALPLCERTRHVVRTLVMTGALSAERVAAALGLHPRTLRRHLEAQGTSLKAIAGATRFDLAQQLLRETSAPLAEVASALGYADLSAFVRAFRAWAGCPPGKWRARHGVVANGAMHKKP